MKAARIILLAGLAAALVALLWQARTIRELRADVAQLRGDLQVALESASETPSGLTADEEQARRERLELIRLRHQVRDLKESVASAHAHEQAANLKTVVRSLLPASATRGPWNFRPEWKGLESLATNQYAQAMQGLSGATNDYTRYLCLGAAAKMSLAVGRTDDARRFATDMLVWDDKFSRGASDKSNGDVVHGANIVLGTIAVDEGRMEEAKRHLLAAGKCNGSPVLGSFGPNMSLANDLLTKGEQATVLQYLELCRKFWTMDNGKLSEWSGDIQAGRMPDFGGSLIH